MKKIILSLLLSSFSLTEAQPLQCKFHNSKKCRNIAHFEKENLIGCASFSGNCRYEFCKANCLVSNNNLTSSCQEHCFDEHLLVRFNEKTRRELYHANYPIEDVTMPAEDVTMDQKLKLLISQNKKNSAFTYNKEKNVHDYYDANKKKKRQYERASQNTGLLMDLWRQDSNISIMERTMNKREGEVETRPPA